eukprot:scaffold6318_cov155-Amphora_coffeaeformis.AAC.1
MERKYWPHVTSILHLNDAAGDARRLLEQVGAWDEFGASGWGSDGKASIFGTSVTTRHMTNASELVGFYYDTPALVKQVEFLFAKDYKHKLLGFKIGRVAKNRPTAKDRSQNEERAQGSAAKTEKRVPKTVAGTKKKNT